MACRCSAPWMGEESSRLQGLTQPGIKMKSIQIKDMEATSGGKA
ncbi:unnamed protein product [Diplocarpon coronariae]